MERVNASIDIGNNSFAETRCLPSNPLNVWVMLNQLNAFDLILFHFHADDHREDCKEVIPWLPT